ncbi:MAG: PAS domain S-box protein, partial [Anaerolineales bacterium]
EDITESVLATAALQQSEEHFRALIQNSADVIQLVNPEGTIVYVSPSVTRVLGFAPSELVGRPVPELLHPDELERMQASFMGLLQRPGGIETLEQRVRHKDGSWRWIEVTASNLLANPAVRALVINYRDITERKRIEAALRANSEQLQTMTQQLWQAAKLATMGELAASIAHELNNPLGTVSLRIESLLNQSAIDDPRRRELMVVEQEVERMSTLVASLLQFSRRSTSQISTLDVREEIDKSLELIHYLLRQRQIVVQRAIDPDLPMVQADRQQLRQLFLNLFTNAIDAMPRGGTLIIRVNAALPAHISIEVADTGTGIAPDDLAKVMEPFFTTKPEGKGTGLGLAICRRIVQEHNGTFEITSPGTGFGATVRLTLPGKHESNGAFLGEA